MTRVWSLSSADEPQESQLFFVRLNESKELSFDSGYDSELNINVNPLNDVNEAQEFDDNCNDFGELDNYSNVNPEHRYQEFETSFSNTRVQSSPIPIPQNRRYKNSSINHSNSCLSTHSSHSFASSTLSSHISDSVHCLIGHPPYACGCIRGYRNPHFANHPTQSTGTSESANVLPLSLMCSNQRESTGRSTGAKKLSYPLPDIISSSQNRTLMNEIIREIGSDLRRISKDFITTRNHQKTESRQISLITRVLRLAIPYVLKEVSQLF